MASEETCRNLTDGGEISFIWLDRVKGLLHPFPDKITLPTLTLCLGRTSLNTNYWLITWRYMGEKSGHPKFVL